MQRLQSCLIRASEEQCLKSTAPFCRIGHACTRQLCSRPVASRGEVQSYLAGLTQFMRVSWTRRCRTHFRKLIAGTWKVERRGRAWRVVYGCHAGRLENGILGLVCGPLAGLHDLRGETREDKTGERGPMKTRNAGFYRCDSGNSGPRDDRVCNNESE